MTKRIDIRAVAVVVRQVPEPTYTALQTERYRL